MRQTFIALDINSKTFSHQQKLQLDESRNCRNKLISRGTEIRSLQRTILREFIRKTTNCPQQYKQRCVRIEDHMYTGYRWPKGI